MILQAYSFVSSVLMAVPVDYDAADFWFKVFIFVWATANSVYTWWSNRDTARKEAIEHVDRSWRLSHTEQQKAMADLKRELDLMRSDVNHLPGREDMRRIHDRIEGIEHRLADRIGDVERGVGELAGAVKGVTAQLHMINKHLLEQDKK